MATSCILPLHRLICGFAIVVALLAATTGGALAADPEGEPAPALPVWQMEWAAQARAVGPIAAGSYRTDSHSIRHLVYGGGQLHHAWRSDNAWQVETIAAAPAEGAILTIDGEDSLHVLARDPVSGALHYQQRIDAQWRPYALPDSAGADMRYGLAVDSVRRVYMAYGVGGEIFVTAGELLGGWTVERVGAGVEPVLALDGVGGVHLLYREDATLYYAQREPDGWTNEAVVTLADEESWRAYLLLFDSHNVAHAIGNILAPDPAVRRLVDFVRQPGDWHEQTLLTAQEYAAIKHHVVDFAVHVDGRVGAIGDLIVVFDSLAMSGSPYPAYSRSDFALLRLAPGDTWRLDDPYWYGTRSPATGLALNADRPQLHLAFQELQAIKDVPATDEPYPVATRVDAGFSLPGAWPSLVLHDDGHAQISHFDLAASAVLFSENPAGAWRSEVIDELFQSWEMSPITALANTPDGATHLLYSRYCRICDTLLHLVRQVGIWQPGAAVGWPSSSRSYQLAADTVGELHVVRLGFRPEQSPLDYLRIGVPTSHQVLDADARVASMALDSLDIPHVAYAKDGIIRYLVLDSTVRAGAAPSGTVLTGVTATVVSLALDGQDYPHIGFYDRELQALRVVSWDGATYRVETVDATGDMGQYLALGANGSVLHVAYYDATNQDLKYAWRGADGWHITTVDSAGDAGKYVALALDKRGAPHVAYYNDVGPGLKYAYLELVPVYLPVVGRP